MNPDPQRNALSEFLAGHISAGQLSDRIRLQRPPGQPHGATGKRSHGSRGVIAVCVIAAIAAVGAGVAVAVGAGSLGAHPGTIGVHRPKVARRSALHRAMHHGVSTGPRTGNQTLPVRAQIPARKSKPAAQHPSTQHPAKQHGANPGTVGFPAAVAPTLPSPPLNTTTSAATQTTSSTPTATATTTTTTTTTSTAPSGTTSTG